MDLVLSEDKPCGVFEQRETAACVRSFSWEDEERVKRRRRGGFLQVPELFCVR